MYIYSTVLYIIQYTLYTQRIKYCSNDTYSTTVHYYIHSILYNTFVHAAHTEYTCTVHTVHIVYIVHTVYTVYTVHIIHTDYRLSINGYTGTAGDMMTPHNKWSFTTIDRGLTGCVRTYDGNGWWFHDKGCFGGNLNGQYICGQVKKTWVGVVWWSIGDSDHSMKYVEMKIR